MSRTRGFEVCKGFDSANVRLPERATAHSAGYDFFSCEDYVLEEGEMRVISTGVKAYMQSGEVLILADRSSNSKKGIFLANSIGVIDSDYYGNADNDGHIMFKFKSEKIVRIKKGDKIGQGFFTTYLKADEDDVTTTRQGGFGSTDAQ